ncbi:MAG: carbohydrate porin [Hyphomicrobium sp.]
MNPAISTGIALVWMLTGTAARANDVGNGWAELAARPSLLDGAGGPKEALRSRGVSTDFYFTQFYQGMTKGDGRDFGRPLVSSAGPDNWDYGSRVDAYVRLDGQKLGLWQGLFVSLHQEWVWGDLIDAQGGTVIPVNTSLAFPTRGGHDRDTSIIITQAFSQSLIFSAGKFNMFEPPAKTPLLGGGGLDTFMNTALAAPITGIIPPYLIGANLTYASQPFTASLFVFDPRNAQDWDVIENPFSDGTNIMLALTVPVKPFGLQGYQNVRVVTSTQDGINLSDVPELLLPGAAGGIVSRKKDRWYFSYSFQQYLYQSPSNPQQGWGLFGQYATSDGNPNPLDSSWFVGIGGNNTLIAGREQDRWGVAYFRDNLSDALSDALDPLGIRLDHEAGWEAFYNVAVTPWFRVTADAQFIHPLFSDAEDAVFVGLRNQIKF